MNIVGPIWNFLQKQAAQGHTPIALRGPRRASKTWTVVQFLLDRMYQDGDEVIFASMTEVQGDAGVYNDCCKVIADEEWYCNTFAITRSPRRIESRCFAANGRRGVATFRSFRDPESAKGAACDWIFINEANKFSLQQYYDLAPNARKGVIIDFNPNFHFWAEEIVPPSQELHVHWEWNRRNLTQSQIQWFEDVTERGTREGHTSADEYYYRVYVLGEYAEISGDIFTPANIRREELDLQGLTNYFIYADPSALCGADYFACVLGAERDGLLYIVDAFSTNVGGKRDIAEHMQAWCLKYDVREIWIEGNGLVGKQFYEEQGSTFGGIMHPYTNRDNKHGRIIGNYENICTKVVFNDTPEMAEFLSQVYEYTNKDSAKVHDDNIDAVNSAYEIAHRRYGVK